MLRVAVIGAGSMGRNHARVLRTTKDVEIVAIVDPEVERAKELVRIYGGKAFGCVDDALMNAVDAAVVAVPTHLHYQVAAPLLRAGVHLLVEKPLASTVEEAEALRRLAEQNRCVLAVGHIERFNPAVRLLAERLAEGRIGRVFEVRARRLGPFPVRIRDVGVVLDLATHDLDIFRFLLRSEVMRVFAEGLGALCTQREDSVTALLRFESGAIGVIEASWITPTKVRELIVVGEGGMFRVDYLTQDL
ncbi:MAG: Gfo/Idh/MocA family oxidoreductase, partial [Deltaproteobacteria bacterium]|nr:Gfo/Idh/MocA family oxidoreductase [Deltaproteobacteria bacterium]